MLVLVSVVGCSQPAAAPAPTAPAAAPAATAAPAPAAPAAAPAATAAPAPAAPAKPTGQLTVAASYYGREILDNAQGGSSSQQILEPFFDWLVGADANGPSKKTGVAEDWELSKDGMTWTFKIRKGIKFHNGDDLTAEDVKFSLERVVAPTSRASYKAGVANAIKSVEVKDPYTVIVNGKVPMATLLVALSPLSGGLEGIVVNKKYFEAQGEKAAVAKAIGSGPYKFKEQQIGSFLTYEAVPNHWRAGTPKYQNITFKVVPEEGTRVAMLQRGEADIIEVARDRGIELEKSGFTAFAKQDSKSVTMVFSLIKAGDHPITNIKVRQALDLAIDKSTLLKAIYMGKGNLTGNFAVMPWSTGYEALPVRPFDAAKAKQLLTEAGYANGFDLDLFSFAISGAPEVPTLNEAIAGYWNKVGVRTKVIPVDYVTFSNDSSAGNLKAGVATYGFSIPALPFSYHDLIFIKGGKNYMVADPKLAELITKAEGSANLEETAAGVKASERYMYDQNYVIPIVATSVEWSANPKTVKDWNLGRAPYGLNLESLFKQ